MPQSLEAAFACSASHVHSEPFVAPCDVALELGSIGSNAEPSRWSPHMLDVEARPPNAGTSDRRGRRNVAKGMGNITIIASSEHDPERSPEAVDGVRKPPRRRRDRVVAPGPHPRSQPARARVA